ncbi:MAG: crossover junction endodeoxyribonuclease RuvC [Deltaproteobacteria bacterium]|nr:crossover junction endodeoxyribonuclease RuvC [Deltaproteobacteria bacterium]
MNRRFTSPPGAGAPQGLQRIMGIDPGTVITGWGVVEAKSGTLRHLGHGTIGAAATVGHGDRLLSIYRGLQQVFRRHKPQGICLEKIFFARNAASALKLGQARGVAMLAAAEGGLDIYEHTSAEIKLAVVGYGQASKDQVQKMVSSLLDLSGPLQQDAADALAAAISCLHRSVFETRILQAQPWKMAPNTKRFRSRV